MAENCKKMPVNKKCNICLRSEANQSNFGENVPTTDLSNIIKSLCGELANITPNAVQRVCQECTYRLVLAEKLVNKVRLVFSAKSANRTQDLESDFVFNCEVCDYTTNKLKEFRCHMLNDHEVTILKPYSCKLCEEKFLRLDYYQNHQAKHGVVAPQKKASVAPTLLSVNENGEEILICGATDCNYKASNHKTFRRHMLNVHKVEDNSKIFRCEICLKCYERINAFKHHIQTCTGNESASLVKQQKNQSKMALVNNVAAMSTTLSQTAEKLKKKRSGENGNRSTINISPQKKIKLEREVKAAEEPSQNNQSQITYTGNETVVPEKQHNNQSQITLLNNVAATSTPMSQSAKELKKKKNGILGNCNSTIIQKPPKKKKKLESEIKAVEEPALISEIPTQKKKKIMKNVKNTTAEHESVVEESVVETFICEYCNKILYSSEKLNRHLSKKHSDQ